MLPWFLPYKLKQTSGSGRSLSTVWWGRLGPLVNLWSYWSVEDGGVSFSKVAPGSPNNVQHPALLKRLIQGKKVTLRVWPIKYFVPVLFCFFYIFMCHMLELPLLLTISFSAYISISIRQVLAWGKLNTFNTIKEMLLNSQWLIPKWLLSPPWTLNVDDNGRFQVKRLTQGVMVKSKDEGETSDILNGDGRSPDGTEIPNHTQAWGPKPVLPLTTKLLHDNSINHNPPHCNFLI